MLERTKIVLAILQNSIYSKISAKTGNTSRMSDFIS